MTDLKPCPFCGSDVLDVFKHNFGAKMEVSE